MPLVVNSDLKMMTLSSGLSTLKGQFTANFSVRMADSLLAMLLYSGNFDAAVECSQYDENSRLGGHL